MDQPDRRRASVLDGMQAVEWSVQNLIYDLVAGRYQANRQHAQYDPVKERFAEHRLKREWNQHTGKHEYVFRPMVDTRDIYMSLEALLKCDERGSSASRVGYHIELKPCILRRPLVS